MDKLRRFYCRVDLWPWKWVSNSKWFMGFRNATSWRWDGYTVVGNGIDDCAFFFIYITFILLLMVLFHIRCKTKFKSIEYMFWESDNFRGTTNLCRLSDFGVVWCGFLSHVLLIALWVECAIELRGPTIVLFKSWWGECDLCVRVITIILCMCL